MRCRSTLGYEIFLLVLVGGLLAGVDWAWRRASRADDSRVGLTRVKSIIFLAALLRWPLRSSDGLRLDS